MLINNEHPYTKVLAHHNTLLYNVVLQKYRLVIYCSYNMLY